jgi:lipopolysaccharide/colanic/teichoic acid biosynthesis glycosyltransferase
MLTPRKPLLAQLPSQLVVLSWCILFPSLLALYLNTNAIRDVPNFAPSIGHWNSLIAAIVAACLGLSYSKLLPPHLSKTNLGSTAVPIFIALLIMFLLSILLRIPMSRYVVVSSLIGGGIWVLYDIVIRHLHGKPRYAVLAIGKASSMLSFPQAEWLLIEDVDNIRHEKVDAILTDLAHTHKEDGQRFIIRMLMKGIPVYDFREAREMLLGRVDVSSLSDSALGLHLPGVPYMSFKRLVDFTAAFMLLLPVGAVIVLFAILVRMESSGSPIFTQTRMGQHGRSFRIFKLRSMRTLSETQAKLSYTEANDPRITRIGKFIRKYRIDELPQIFNIIAGHMSWIGPRPESIDLADEYESRIPFYIYRHTVKPGITGWAQVMQGNVNQVENIKLKLQYDFYYIKHLSLWMDIVIALKTARTILTGFGAR